MSCFSSATALSTAVSEDIADIEAMGIYKGISPYFKASHISFLKVISDNFNPDKFNKGFIISLIQNQLAQIQEHISYMEKTLND